MEKVDGVGGIFFRAKNPDELAKWYSKNLGVDEVPQDYETRAWQNSGGSCVFAPFSEDTEYFPKTSQFMINFRVSNLDAMIIQLEANGNTVTTAESEEPNGKFAWVFDPEGNKIELWEPK